MWQHDSLNRPAGGHPGQTYDTYTVPFDLSYELDLWGAYDAPSNPRPLKRSQCR